MIGLDTNVLLRWLIDETHWPDADKHQSELAAEAIRNSNEKFYVNSIVMAETIWVLAQPLKIPRPSIVAILKRLLNSTNLEIEHRREISDALAMFETEPAGLNDCIIGELNMRAGCRTTLTFDRKAGNTAGFTRLWRKVP